MKSKADIMNAAISSKILIGMFLKSYFNITHMALKT